MGSNYKTLMAYEVDLVFCIDATGSMDPILDTVKSNALNFYQDFMGVMEAMRIMGVMGMMGIMGITGVMRKRQRGSASSKSDVYAEK